jgi:hypothetical protein
MFQFIKTFIQHYRNLNRAMHMTLVSSKVPAIPYDENFKPTFVPMIAIVDVSGNITGYLPLAAQDNGDGTASIKVTN